MERPIILFDTDMESDCDDAGALALLLNACRAGEAQLLGVIADTPGVCVAPCCEAFLRHYGVSAPIGAVRAAEYAQSPRFAAYRAHCAAMPPRMFYNRTLAAQVGRTDADYEDAARAYRRMLVSAGDGSVTLVCVGFLTALAALLQTGPDDLSPLTGAELLRRKVQRLISMGDAPVDGRGEVSFNYAMDLVASETFFARCPVPVTVSPEGTDVLTGAHLCRALPGTHPLRIAYEQWNGPDAPRPSWDLIAVHYALHPDAPCFRTQTHGTVQCSAQPARVWWTPGPRADSLLTLTVPPDRMRGILEKTLF